METADSPDSADSDMVSRAQFVSRNTLGTQKPRSLGTSEALREDTLVARLEQHVKAAKKYRRVSVLSILEESVRIGVRTDSNAFKFTTFAGFVMIYIYILKFLSLRLDAIGMSGSSNTCWGRGWLQLLHKVYHSSISMYIIVSKYHKAWKLCQLENVRGIYRERAERDQDVQFSQKGLPDGCRGLPYSAMCNDGRIDS